MLLLLLLLLLEAAVSGKLPALVCGAMPAGVVSSAVGEASEKVPEGVGWGRAPAGFEERVGRESAVEELALGMG